MKLTTTIISAASSLFPMAQVASPKTENYVIIKLLIPVYCAGACIGKDGLEIQRIKSESGARVKVSRNRDLFPRTDERVVLVSGTPDQVLEVIKFIQEKIQNENPPDNRKVNPKRKDQVKLIVAHSAAGRIIGRKGEKVNKLKQDFNVKVYITNKDENIPTLNERVVTIEGEADDVRETAKDIIHSIQENPEARLSRSLEYRRFSENPYGPYFYTGPPPPPFRGAPGSYGSPPGQGGGYGRGYQGGSGGPGYGPNFNGNYGYNFNNDNRYYGGGYGSDYYQSGYNGRSSSGNRNGQRGGNRDRYDYGRRDSNEHDSSRGVQYRYNKDSRSVE